MDHALLSGCDVTVTGPRDVSSMKQHIPAVARSVCRSQISRPSEARSVHLLIALMTFHEKRQPWKPVRISTFDLRNGRFSADLLLYDCPDRVALKRLLIEHVKSYRLV